MGCTWNEKANGLCPYGVCCGTSQELVSILDVAGQTGWNAETFGGVPNRSHFGCRQQVRRQLELELSQASVELLLEADAKVGALWQDGGGRPGVIQEGCRFPLGVCRSHLPSCVDTHEEAGAFRERVDHPHAAGVDVKAKLIHLPGCVRDDFSSEKLGVRIPCCGWPKRR